MKEKQNHEKNERRKEKEMTFEICPDERKKKKRSKIRK